MQYRHIYNEDIVSAFCYNGNNIEGLMGFVAYHNQDYSVTIDLKSGDKVLFTLDGNDITRVFADDVVLFKDGKICTMEQKLFSVYHTPVENI